MTKLVGFAGSLRRASYNRALLRAAAELMPSGATLEIVPIDDIPLYNGDVEASGIPPAVTALKEAIATADGLVIATPEYNNSIPGVAKNVIDWASRPPSDVKRVLHGKPVALLGASPGRFGTILSQSAWGPVLRTLRMKLWTGAGPFYLASAASEFDENGSMTHAETRERLREYLAAFVAELKSRPTNSA